MLQSLKLNANLTETSLTSTWKLYKPTDIRIDVIVQEYRPRRRSGLGISSIAATCMNLQG